MPTWARLIPAAARGRCPPGQPCLGVLLDVLDNGAGLTRLWPAALGVHALEVIYPPLTHAPRAPGVPVLRTGIPLCTRPYA